MGELTNRTTRTSAQFVSPVRTTRTHPYRGCALCVILCAAAVSTGYAIAFGREFFRSISGT